MLNITPSASALELASDLISIGISVIVLWLLSVS